MARPRGSICRHTVQPSPAIILRSVELCPQSAFPAHASIDRTTPLVVGVQRRMWPKGAHR